MPSQAFELASDEPLFPPDDPLTVSIPGDDKKLRKFRCKDRANVLQVEPDAKPITWFVEELTHQIVEDEQEAFRAALVHAIEAGLIDNMPDKEGRTATSRMLSWVIETRQAAEKGTLARTVRRPTAARKRSTR